MRLIHVVPHIDQEAAGPSYSVPRLCQSLAISGNEVELMCLAARENITGFSLDVHPQWSWFKRFAISPSLARALARKASIADIVHNHSLWSMVNIAAGWVVPGKKAKLVTSPRGTLSPVALQRSRVLKRMMWSLQRRALACADMLHATSEVELQEIRAQGFSSPVMVLPNGIDLPQMPDPVQKSLGGQRTLLYLSRIHPIKGLDHLLHAWVALERLYPDWRLVIAGTGEVAHVQEIHALAASLGVSRVEFPGPAYGAAKSRAYWDADLMVLPTHSENFGMVVAEALAHGCPAVVSKGAPWSGLLSEGCGWWVENDIPTLTATLETAMALPSAQLSEMGLRGRAWMERDFAWDGIARKMEIAYRWLLEGGDRPEWVRI